MWSFQHFYPLLSYSSEVSIHFFIFTRYREWFSDTFPHMQRIFTHTCRENCFLPPFLSTYLSLGEKRERECGEWYCFSIATGTALPRNEAQMVLCHSCHQCSFVSSCEFCGVEYECVFPLYLWPLWFLYSFVDLHTTFLPEFLLLSGLICPRYVNAHLLSFTADTCLSLDFRLVVFPVTSNLWSIVKTHKSADCPHWLVWWRLQTIFY